MKQIQDGQSGGFCCFQMKRPTCVPDTMICDQNSTVFISMVQIKWSKSPHCELDGAVLDTCIIQDQSSEGCIYYNRITRWENWKHSIKEKSTVAAAAAAYTCSWDHSLPISQICSRWRHFLAQVVCAITHVYSCEFKLNILIGEPYELPLFLFHMKFQRK